MAFFKDESLDKLADWGNVAQFVSFEPAPNGRFRQRFSRVAGFAPNYEFESIAEAVENLIDASSEHSVNIRSFVPNDPRSKEFIYGLTEREEVLRQVERLGGLGLYLIVNETIDVSDGGVSGVLQGGVIEFAPDDTPRCVEKPGVASLPADLGLRLIETVYGFRAELPLSENDRVEFSVHPRLRGWKQSHTLTWERELGVDGSGKAKLAWPNRFSRHIGDKAFGLLMAHELGFAVPHTLVIGRRVGPFAFGRATGSAEVWTRTCPIVPEPGRFTTVKGWTDPFALMSDEDPTGTQIASVLSQAAVPAHFSGAAIVDANGYLIVEGKQGEGDRFMLGLALPEYLPSDVLADVNELYERLSASLGAVRFEWVHDGATAWLVQLHRGATSSAGSVLVPGDTGRWERIDAAMPLPQIRAAIDALDDGVGLSVVGDIGLTSHIADVIRKAGRPARLEAA
jgi:hypothetical protein